MKKVTSIISLLLCGIIQAQATKPPVVSLSNPNIVFILADDLGYGELGCYGQEKIQTPHIDQLAAEGMRFTQHYSGAPVCGPARCVLLTGKHLAHAEVRGNKEYKTPEKVFGGQHPLSAEAVTIAKVLKEQGYTTGAFGKWGLGASASTGSPIKQGFDRFYGYNCQRNAHSYYPPYLDSDEEEVISNTPPISGHMRQPKGEVLADTYRGENYAPDLILAESLKFIDENKDKPFFLYLPFVEPHVAMQPPQEWMDRYPEEWDDKPYRGQRGYTPHPRPRAGYAAMISDLDEHVGAILARLKAYGLEDNTIVIFTSDNGATHDVGGVDTNFFNSVGELRGRKGSCYEGGLRVPCIVRYPGKVEPGTSTDTPSYFPDWFPTLTAIGGADSTQYAHDGIDLRHTLAGEPAPTRIEAMTWEFYDYGGIVAIREGKWKALRRDTLKQTPKPWELYDIEADPSEKQDLAKQHPERVQRLEAAWLQTRIANPTFKQPLAD